MSVNRFAQLRERLNLDGVPEDLLELAFTHSSYARERGLDELASNQRLEYLGDAVLDLVFASYLYEAYPEMPEGDLTRLKAAVVRKSALASIARELDLDSSYVGRILRLALLPPATQEAILRGDEQRSLAELIGEGWTPLVV